jgi:hypothetical protein
MKERVPICLPGSMVMTIPSLSLRLSVLFHRESTGLGLLTAHSSLWSSTRANLSPKVSGQRSIRKRGKEKLANPDWVRQVMRVQNALQNGPLARHADFSERRAQEVDGEAVQAFERVAPRDTALVHERFLCCEQDRVELALWWGESAVHGESARCAKKKKKEQLNTFVK